MFRLTVEKGEPLGAVFDLRPGESVLGRSHSCSVRLLSQDVSGQHARIKIDKGAARLENLSQFGTRVDQAPVTNEVLLTNGQRIEIGKATVLRFTQDEDSDAPTGGAMTHPEPLGTGGGGLLTGALSHPGVTMGEPDEEGATRAMQTRAATPEEIALLKDNEQKRARRHLVIGLAVAIPALILVFIFRPRTPPPETEIDWSKDAKGEYCDDFLPAPSGGLKEGGYDVMFPGNKTFKKSAVAGGLELEGLMGRNLDVPMRVILQEESDTRLAGMSREAMVEDWIQQMSASGGRWNFDKPSPAVSFFGKKNGVPFTRVTYLRDGNGSWFGTASVMRHGCRRIVTRAEVPASERVRAENMLSTKLIKVSDEFQYAYWESNPVAATLSEEQTLTQIRKDLDRVAPATWVAMKGMLSGLLTKAVLAGHKDTEAEAVQLLLKLRERQALWYNSQQLAFDAALMQGNLKKAEKIAEFTKAVFSDVDDQRYFDVRKWKTGP